MMIFAPSRLNITPIPSSKTGQDSILAQPVAAELGFEPRQYESES